MNHMAMYMRNGNKVFMHKNISHPLNGVYEEHHFT